MNDNSENVMDLGHRELGASSRPLHRIRQRDEAFVAAAGTPFR